MREVSVNLNDLKKLVIQLRNCEANSRAEASVLTSAGFRNPSAAAVFLAAVEKAKPDAEDMVNRRYKALLEAIESGNNVRDSLSNFSG